jgi:hypothetical protein
MNDSGQFWANEEKHVNWNYVKFFEVDAILLQQQQVQNVSM